MYERMNDCCVSLSTLLCSVENLNDKDEKTNATFRSGKISLAELQICSSEGETLFCFTIVLISNSNGV